MRDLREFMTFCSRGNSKVIAESGRNEGGDSNILLVKSKSWTSKSKSSLCTPRQRDKLNRGEDIKHMTDPGTLDSLTFNSNSESL